MQELLRSIRESCSAATWSRGVELARAGAVVGEEDDGDEIAFRVATRGGLVSPQVVLFPDDEDWTCECNSTEDACAHVAAAAIALRQARKEGKAMPGVGDEAPGHVAYRLQGNDGRLCLFRTVVAHGDETRLEGSLATLALGQVKGPKFVATDADLRFEKLLGTFTGGVIPRPLMQKIFDALRGVKDLKLDGETVTVGAPTSGMAVRVTEVADGFLLRLEQAKDVDRIYDNGAVKRGDTVEAIGEHGLSEGEFDGFRKGKHIAARDVGTLVGDLLPRLRRHVSVVVDADLPQSRSVKPRIVVATKRIGDALEVLPTIVYGDPPIARVTGERVTMLREGEVPLRNARLERQLLERLKVQGLETGARELLPAGRAIELVAALRDGKELSLTGGDHKDFRATGALTPHLEVDEDGGFSLWFEPSEGGRVDGTAAVRAWERGEQFAPLMEGGFGQLPQEWLSAHGHRVAALLAATEAGKGDGPAHAPWAFADLAALCESLEQPPPPGFDRLRALVDGFEGIPDAQLPGDLRATLRGYQERGVAWLAFLREAGLGALLADDMGLGKTIQALCVLSGPTLVVAPTSVLHNWAKEAEKFRPTLRVNVYHGPGRALDDADLTLTTYALLRLDIEALAARKWSCAVLDEAQAIKNPDSQVARAAYRLEADFRMALTGTPVENRLDDLWSQFHFINRGLLGGRSEFNDRYVRPIGAGDQGTAAMLRARIRPFVLRRLKKEVASELPPRTDLVLQCELGQAERQVYDTVRAATQKEVVQKLGGGAGVMAMLEALLRLRQAACHSALLPGQEAQAPNASAKVALLVETLDEVVEEGHKVLVFSQWTSMLSLIEPHLTASGIEYLRLDGSTRDRGAVVERFQSDDGPPVMLISLRAGGTGLNLTAADNVFLVDPWWNPAVEDQAADRAHRIGQTKPVFVHRLVARNTVEEKILALQSRKRELADAALGDAAGATAITREELMDLLD